MKKYLFLFLFSLVLVSTVSGASIRDAQTVGVSIEYPNASPSGGGGNSSFNETTGNSLWWRLDGTNAPPTADWNMGGKGFKNVGNTNFSGNLNMSGNKIFLAETGVWDPYLKSNSFAQTILGNVSSFKITGYSGTDMFYFSDDFSEPIYGILIGDGFPSKELILNGTNEGINLIGNVTAQNLCYSNGSNCMSSAGGNASWNQSYANTLYSDIKWGYNQTQPAINIAQNYSQTYYASQGYRQTICFSMGNLANTGYLSFGGLVHTATSSFLALHNGSILGSTSSWRQSGAAIIAGNEVNATLNLTINGVSTISNNILNVATGSTGQFINDATRNQYTFTRGSNISVLYTKLLGTGSVGFPSYCVEYVYDQ